MTFQSPFARKCSSVLAPTHLNYCTGIFSLLFAITSVPGNLLIILAVVLDPNKNLRSPFSWLVVNLATSDLVVGAITDPVSAYIHLKEVTGTKITKVDVRAIHLSYFISCTASVLSLSALAVERYLAIRKPQLYRNDFTTKRILLTVIAIWLIALSLPQIYFVVGVTMYALIFANTSILVTIGITCFTYIFMIRNARERTRNIRITNEETRVPDDIPPTHTAAVPCTTVPVELRITQTEAPAIPYSRNSVLTSTRLIEEKVTKTFFVVLTALLFCYGPSTIMIYIMNFCESCNCSTLHWLRDLQFLFVALNSSINFFVYALQSSRFRKAFTKILRLNWQSVSNMPNICKESPFPYTNQGYSIDTRDVRPSFHDDHLQTNETVF